MTPGPAPGQGDPDDPADGTAATGPAGGSPDGEDEPEMSDLFDELAELETVVDSPAEREQVRETMRTAVDAQQSVVFGRVIWGFDRADLAETLVGAFLFGLPMFVEGGTLEVGAHLATFPPALVLTDVVAVGLVVGILYVSDIQDVRIHRPLFGYVPRRLVGVLGISLLTAVVMMTAWGQVTWDDSWLAFCQCSVAFVPMAVGGALGDILPGT